MGSHRSVNVIVSCLRDSSLLPGISFDFAGFDCCTTHLVVLLRLEGAMRTTTGTFGHRLKAGRVCSNGSLSVTFIRLRRP